MKISSYGLPKIPQTPLILHSQQISFIKMPHNTQKNEYNLKSLELVISDILSLEDFEVETAQNGEEAIEMIDQDYYDIALIDLNMPKVDGMEVLKYLVEHRSVQ